MPSPRLRSGYNRSLDERTLVRTIRQTGIRTLVVPDFGEHYFQLNHMLRQVPSHQLLNTPFPQFGTMMYRRQPFLLYSNLPFALTDFQRGAAKKSLLFQHLIP